MELFIKKISVENLVQGMQTINPEIDWTKNPFVFDQEKYIASQEHINEITEAGYKEVYIDLGRSDTSLFSKDLANIQAQPTWVDSPRLIPINEEMPKAAKILDDSVQYAKRFMLDAQVGKVDMQSATPIVEQIMESITRNADALISLAKLRSSDEYTYTHCVNVSILSACYSKFLNNSPDEIFKIGLAGLLHDLGKALVPPLILNAPRKLNSEEFAIIQKHPIFGYDELIKVNNIATEVLSAAAEHHEKFDGTGYPRGLIGDQISQAGRIIGVADVYDALTSRRIYKDAMSAHKALGIMYQMRDKHFSTANISEFIRMIGIYPVGSVVKLEEDFTAVVSQSNQKKPTQPKVIMVFDPKGNFMQNDEYDISKGEAPAIREAIINNKVNPLRVLSRTA